MYILYIYIYIRIYILFEAGLQKKTNIFGGEAWRENRLCLFEFAFHCCFGMLEMELEGHSLVLLMLQIFFSQSSSINKYLKSRCLKRPSF